MTSKLTIEIGKTKANKKFRLPVNIATETFAIFGRRGSGKSNSATVIVEGLLETGHQVVLLDPKGEGWGLKSSRDGTKAAHDVIVFGEPEGDLPLNEKHGERLAQFVVESGRSCVMSLLGLDSVSKERTFVADFCERLYRLKSKPENRTPLMVVIEECHLFVPQRVGSDQARMVGAIQRLVRQGRAFGLGVMLVDQRPASVNADVRTQAEILVCHQVTHKLDRKALDEWVEAHDTDNQRRTFMDSIAGLQPGEAWVWSPARLDVFERVNVNRRATYDSGATPDGTAVAAKPVKHAIDLDALRDELDEMVEKARANDPKTLWAEIKRLERELTQAQQMDDVEERALAMIENYRSHCDVVVDEFRERLTTVIRETAIQLPDLNVTGISPRSAGRTKGKPASGHTSGASVSTTPKASIVSGPPAASAPSGTRVPSRNNGQSAPSKTGKPEQRIINALGWWENAGVNQPTRHQVAFVAGYTVNGHFNNVLGRLKGEGILDYPAGGMLCLTDEGRKLADVPGGALSFEALIECVRGVLRGEPQRRVFDAALELGETTRDELAAKAGYTVNGHFNNVLGKLNTLGVLRYPRPGMVGLGQVFDAFWSEVTA